MKQVTITVPATSANLGPGFDCLGLALALYNQFTFTPRPDGLKINVSGAGSDQIPTDSSNLAAQAAHRLFEQASANGADEAAKLSSLPFHIQINNNVPAMSGLGSSSTAVIGGLLGANAFLRQPYDRRQILQIAHEIEGHPDNVTPALCGGAYLIVTDQDLIAQRLESPILQAVIVTPDYYFPTNEARQALPRHLPVADVIYNASRLGLFIQAFQAGDYPRLAAAMDDKLHQPYRLPLIPGAEEALAAARQAGAAAALSGAGPSLIAFAPDDLPGIGAIMAGAFAAANIPAQTRVLALDQSGARIEMSP